jgi:sterol 14-demethylase
LDDNDFSPIFLRFLRSIFTTERFSRGRNIPVWLDCYATDAPPPDLPVLVHDAKEGLRTLATSSSTIINPFDGLFKVIFQLTARELCCNDLADQTELLDKMIHLFLTVGTSYNPRIILFPSLMKLLSPAHWKQMSASIRMYMLVKGILDQRKRSAKRDTDPLQHLIDQGIKDTNIIQVRWRHLCYGSLAAHMLYVDVAHRSFRWDRK